MAKPSYRSPHRPLPVRSAKRRLALGLVLSGVVLAIPVGVLVVLSYEQLRHERFYQYQAAAAEVVNRINERVYQVLKPESARPFDQYGFFSVPKNALVPESTLNISPLAELGPETTVPGVIGYFQIDPDGSFHSPLLPERDLAGASVLKAMSQDELGRRQTLRSKLKTMLGEGESKSGRREAARPSAGAEGLAILPFPDRTDEKTVGTVHGGSGNPVASTPGEARSLADLELDEGLYRKREDAVAPSDQDQRSPRLSMEAKSLSQAPRKEILSYLEDPVAPASGLPELPADAASAVPLENTPATADRPAAPLALPALRQGAKIERFEGEIYPIELEVLQNGDFSFYRKVWRDRQRYVQGFVVKGDEFLREVFETAFRGSVLWDRAALIVAYRDRILRSYGTAPREGGILLLRTGLAIPLEAIRIVFSVNALPLGSGAGLVNGMAVLVLVLIPGVLYGVYRLGRAHIELAQERSNFVSAVSHELKTPLTSIRMYGEILRSGWVESEDKKRSYYDFIFFESERLSRLIANVLELARLANHGSALALKPYEPDRLLDLVRSKVHSQIEAAGFQMEVRGGQASSGLTIAADEDAVSRIFINLVDNALKFSRASENKVVHIGYRMAEGGRRRAGEVSFFVRDFGPGIDRAHQKKLFQLFYRGENELTRATPGTGIGLALVGELAAKMDARVDWENQYPGAEFCVRFRVAAFE